MSRRSTTPTIWQRNGRKFIQQKDPRVHIQQQQQQQMKEKVDREQQRRAAKDLKRADKEKKKENRRAAVKAQQVKKQRPGKAEQERQEHDQTEELLRQRLTEASTQAAQLAERSAAAMPVDKARQLTSHLEEISSRKMELEEGLSNVRLELLRNQ
ncbi:unnamed protein product, partial [Symbiodinium natans]